MTSKSDLAAKMMDTGRIGVRLADQVRHQREVIQSLQREKLAAINKSQQLEAELRRSNDSLSKVNAENVALSQAVETLKAKLTDLQLDYKKALKENELVKLELDENGKRSTEESLHHTKRIASVTTETENLTKENVAMRMYVSRLEAEVDIARRNLDDLAENRHRDARVIDAQKLRIESLSRKCVDLEGELSEATTRLGQVEREQVKRNAAMDLMLSEKNLAISTLEKSLRIAADEISAGEKEIGVDLASLQKDLTRKENDIKELTATVRVLERERQDHLHSIDALSLKYQRSKAQIRNLLETVRTYEATFEASLQMSRISLVGNLIGQS